MLVERLEHPPIKTVKKPIFRMPTSSASDSASSSYHGSALQKAKTGPKNKGHFVKVARPKSSKNIIRLPARAPLSSPPSHAPTPPPRDTVVAIRGGSNKFTEADDEFFYKYIQWQHGLDSPLSKTIQCEQMAKLVSSLGDFLVSDLTTSFNRRLIILPLLGNTTGTSTKTALMKYSGQPTARPS